MGMIGSLLRNLRPGSRSRQQWTPAEVRELISRGRLQEACDAVDLLRQSTLQRELIAMCLKGEIAFHEHRDADAEAMFRQALEQAPGLADAQYGLSLVLGERGQHELAVLHAQFAVNSGSEPRFSAQLGLCHIRRGSFAMATAALARATRLDPLDKASWNNLGIVARARRDVPAARAAFKRALEIDPQFESARSNLALLEQDIENRGGVAAPIAPDAVNEDPRLQQVDVLHRAGALSEAIDTCEDLCIREPDEGRFVIELFRLYREQGDTQTGIDALQAFHSRNPTDIDVVSELGCALVKERELRQAKPFVETALAARPGDVDLLLAMADIREEQDRFADAGELVDRAYSVDPSPNIKGRYIASLVTRYRYQEALDRIDEVLQEFPGAADEFLALRVYALTNVGRHDEALPILDKAVADYPHEPIRRFPRATIHLLNERYAEGWDDYALRTLSSVKHLRMLPFPMWGGEPLEGKTILLLAEQGLGDQVMFASCLPDLLALGPARTIVEVVDRVAPTIARAFPQCQIVPTRQDNAFDWVRSLGAIDYFAPIGDLPRVFRRSHADFPAHRGYLRADPARVQHWRDQLERAGEGPYIGLSWRGGIESTRRGLRTLDVERLAPLTERCTATWVCLQYGEVGADLVKAKDAGLAMQYWPESIKDLDDFAALITALDLVITVCNTTVHYAGALDRPVWIMAPKVPEWRYGLHSKVLPWYPSSRIFRQTEAENWRSVLDAVNEELGRFTQGT